MSRKRKRTWSPGCRGKVRFHSQEEAKHAIRSLASSSRDRVPGRAYECSGCRGWHLTST